MASIDAQTAVQEMYIAYYGRPGDEAGLQYWSRIVSENGLESAINAFGNSQEYQDRFGDMSHEELVDNLYQQMFGRDAETTGLNYYTGLLDSGEKTLAEIALSIADGAQGSDQQILDNRVLVGNYITWDFGNFVGDGSIDSTRDMLATVDDSYLSEPEAHEIATNALRTGEMTFTGDDPSVPPAPSYIDGWAGYDAVFINWMNPENEYGNHLLTNVYRSDDDDFDDADLIGAQYHYTGYTDYEAIQESDADGYYYWITDVSTSGVEGPPQSDDGYYVDIPESYHDQYQTEVAGVTPGMADVIA